MASGSYDCTEASAQSHAVMKNQSNTIDSSPLIPSATSRLAFVPASPLSSESAAASVSPSLGISSSALQGVQLKKTKVISTAPTFVSAQVEREQNARLRACDLDFWYSALEEFTFPTVFIPISPDEARALIRAYWSRKASRDGFQPKQHHVETAESVRLLEGLEHRISSALKVLLLQASESSSPASSGVFAKLSSR
jgi:hypothetical protein